jgi:hypothetical protein
MSFSRVLTFETGNSISDTFLLAPPGSAYNQVLVTKMDKDSFIVADEGLARINQNPKLAYYSMYQYTLSYKQYHCKVLFLDFNFLPDFKGLAEKLSHF